MSRLVPFLMLLFVAACAAPATMPETPPETPAESAEKPEIAQPATPAPARPEFGLLPPDHAGLPTAGALKADHLIGLVDSELERILGKPDFRRNDPPAQIWQYRNPSCLFDVFLYQDQAAADAYTVTHIEARGRDVNLVSDRKCFLSVLKDRKKG